MSTKSGAGSATVEAGVGPRVSGSTADPAAAGKELVAGASPGVLDASGLPRFGVSASRLILPNHRQAGYAKEDGRVRH